jgi:hypothetical protein
MRGLRGCLRLMTLAVLAVVVACSLAGSAASQGSTQRPVGPAAKTQSLSPMSKAGGAAVPELGPARSAEELAREAREREGRTALERQIAEAVAALADHGRSLTYATIGLIVVTAGLWLTTFLQSRDIRAAVLAAQESSAAARKSAEFLQRALVLTQRATVIVGEPRAVWLRDGGDRLVGCRLLVSWHNVGTTPTRDMIAAVAGLATEKPPLQNSALPRANARQQPAIVGPNAAINSASVNLPIGLVTDILQHRAHYLFAGWAEYNDVFEHSPRHRVEFCYWLEFEGDIEAQALEARFHIHGMHNRHYESADGLAASGSDAAGHAQLEYSGSPAASDTGPQPR